MPRLVGDLGSSVGVSYNVGKGTPVQREETMDAPTILAFASVAVSLVLVLGLVVPIYLGLGRLEAEMKSGRERSDAQYRQSRECTDD